MNYYPYLTDNEFLKNIDTMPRTEQFIRIYVLQFDTEEVIATIEGKSTGGSVNVSGTSSLRRTASLSLAVDPEGIVRQGQTTPSYYGNITDVENLISLNKKVQIETGLVNLTDQYTEYEIIWLPLGTYIMKSPSVSENNSGVNISLTLNDKSAQLNGTCGGIIPAGVIFSEEETLALDGESSETTYPLVVDIIRSVVVDFGGERPENVIIEDVPLTARKVLKWNGQEPVYLHKGRVWKDPQTQAEMRNKTDNKILTTSNKLNYTPDSTETYNYGALIGYQQVPFTYPGKLECKAGDTVASVLDKIKNVLGNFEWYYDIWGRFHFNQIKNFINESTTKNLLNLTASDYLSVANAVTPAYSFTDKSLLSSISVAPQYDNIKNDFVVWGTTKTVTGAAKPIRYRVVFDSCPSVRTTPLQAIIYKDYRDLWAVIPTNSDNFEQVDSVSKMTNRNKIYQLLQDGEFNEKFFRFDKASYRFVEQIGYKLVNLLPSDWRSELYFQGLENASESFARNPYAAELNSEFPKLYNVCPGEGTETIVGKYYDNIDQQAYEYWLDFIEPDTTNSVSTLSVSNIGRRTKVVIDDKTSCLVNGEVPNNLYIEADGDVDADWSYAKDTQGYEAIQVSQDVWSKITVGATQNSAFDKVKELIQTHTAYNESITLTTLPIYHLEPNTLIEVYHDEMGVNGQYLVKSISLPLVPNGTSNISATKCLQKTI